MHHDFSPYIYSKDQNKEEIQIMAITNPHDLIFKQTESHIENAIDYIKGTCPEKLVKNLNLTMLKIEESSYTTDELKEYFSDLVYQ